MAVSTLTQKIDKIPVNPGEMLTLISVFDPTAVTTLSSTGAVIHTPSGAGGSGPGAAPLAGPPLWLDNAAFTFFGIQERMDDGRVVNETWATVIIYFNTSKPYRTGMLLQINRDGRIMQIIGPNNVDEASRKQYLTCKAVA